MAWMLGTSRAASARQQIPALLQPPTVTLAPRQAGVLLPALVGPWGLRMGPAPTPGLGEDSFWMVTSSLGVWRGRVPPEG